MKKIILTIFIATVPIMHAMSNGTDKKENSSDGKTGTKKPETSFLVTLFWSFISGLATPLPTEFKNINRSNAVFSIGAHGMGLFASVQQTATLPEFDLKHYVANGCVYYVGQAAQIGLWKIINSYKPKEPTLLLFRNNLHTTNSTMWYIPSVAVCGYLLFFKR